MKIRNAILTLVVSLGLIFFGTGVLAHADTINTNQKTVSIQSDLVFTGDFSSHKIYFNVNKWWNVKSAQVTINFTRSQLKSEQAETFFVFYINDIPFKSQQIYYKDNDNIQTLKVNVPIRLMKKGSNTFKVGAYMRISELPCVDDVNPANWATINAGTGIKINFSNEIANNEVANFPYPYIKENDSTNVDTQVVVPNNYTDNDLSSALLMNSYLGRIFNDGNYNGKLVTEGDINKENNIIYIGNYEGLPQELKSKVDIKNVDLNNDAIIKQIQSPYSNNKNIKALMILSNNGDMLTKAVKFMMNPSLVMQINSPRYVVTKDTKVLQKVDGYKDKITMEDLGANGISLEGPFRRSATLDYKLPKNRVLAAGGKVYLNMRYSQNLDFTKSLVTVFINGVPIGSQRLTLAKANGDILELTIPKDIKNSSYLSIEIAFDLEMDNTWCEKRDQKTPWAYVTPDSYIYLPAIETQDYNFNKYPSPYIKDYEFNNVLVVAPKLMNSTQLTNLGNMFSLMGVSTKYNGGSIQVKTPEEATSLEDSKNLIVYGTPSNNELIKKINNNLWFKYNSNYTGFESNGKQYLTTPFNEQITTLQMSKSPFNSQMGMLVMTAPNMNNLEKAMLYLTDPNKILELTGDSAIIDQNGKVVNFTMVEPKDNRPRFSEFRQGNILTIGLIAVLGLIIILIIIAALLYFNKYRKKDSHLEDFKRFRK